jgi:ectoine hydroxylase-related dioxygenase (phytanoyl-CoA dioxygenase family)
MTQRDPGYSIHERLFECAEMAAVLDALGGARLVRTRAGARHVLAVPAVRALASDARLLEVARQYLGSNALPYRATLFDKSAGSNWLVPWHQDTALPVRTRTNKPGWGPWSVKGGVLHAIAPAAALQRVIALRVHLDDSTALNGPLRVLPHTHCGGVLSAEQIQELARKVTPVECLTGAGGVVVMRPLMVHSSIKARDDAPRRVLHIEYAASVDLGGGVELAIG